MKSQRDYWVTVCDHCLRASCWHGLFFCDDYTDAGTVEKKASELRKLKKEHSSYFSVKALTEHCGGVRYVEENTRTDPVKEALAEALLELQRCGQKQGFNSSYESTMKRVAVALRRYEEEKHG